MNTKHFLLEWKCNKCKPTFSRVVQHRSTWKFVQFILMSRVEKWISISIHIPKIVQIIVHVDHGLLVVQFWDDCLSVLVMKQIPQRKVIWGQAKMLLYPPSSPYKSQEFVIAGNIRACESCSRTQTERSVIRCQIWLNRGQGRGVGWAQHLALFAHDIL